MVADLHIHPNIKGYGNSKTKNSKPFSIDDPSCLWYQDLPTKKDEGVENLLGFTPYRQSDLTTCAESQVTIACVSLYPLEKGFMDIRDKSPLNMFEKLIATLVSGIGKKRVEEIRSPHFNYFNDLYGEYQYMVDLHNRPPTGGHDFYQLCKNGQSLQQAKPDSVQLIVTIEGAHALCNGSDTLNAMNWDKVEDRIKEMKAWDYPPFFITLAHHFYNGLCTQAKSLFDISGKLLDQDLGTRDYEHEPIDSITSPIQDLGLTVIRELLSKTNGRRVLIDVKHMSLDARKQYYQLLKTAYRGEPIPVICSHGALAIENEKNFYYHQVNMELETDIQIIYETGGLIGIEMDQRILGYNKNRFWKSVGKIFNNQDKQNFIEAGYFWNQVIRIAEYAYQHQFQTDPWQCICLGSDYDGIINPLNEYRHAGKLDLLFNQLEKHLTLYWSEADCIIPPNHNGLSAAQVIEKIRYTNLKNFIIQHY